MNDTQKTEMAAILTLVKTGRALTRSAIGAALSMRSTSVSELVGELVDRDLLREAAITPKRRGRPAASLSFNGQRFGGIFVGVIDRTIVAKAIDLDYRILAERSVRPDKNSDNDAMAGLLRTLIHQVSTETPEGIEVCTVALSLPGLLDVQRKIWCVSSRWPNTRDLNVAEALDGLPWPVTLVRNLDAELSGIRMNELHNMQEASLLLHWGHGIGAAYSTNGAIINRERGRFCEIGHWSLGSVADLHCACGNTGCLETVAALWALGPKLRERFPLLPEDEQGLAAELRQLDIMQFPEISEAILQVSRLTANLCLLLFPDRIILTGPFVQNPEIFRHFIDTIAAVPLLKSLDRVHVSVNDICMDQEISGVMHGLFEQKILDTL